MINKIALFGFTLISFVLNAQEREIQIEWTGTQNYISDDINIEVPHFEGAIYDLPESIVPTYCSDVEINVWRVSNFSLTDVISVPLEGKELALVQNTSGSVDFNIQANVSGKDRSPRLSFCITTIRKNSEGCGSICK